MCAKGFSFPTIGIEVENKAVLLGIDDFLLPFRKNLCLYLSKPKVWPKPVLTPSRGNRDAPDFLAAAFYGTVLFDEGRFRMWYYALSFGKSPGELTQGPMCYAESEDGIRWTKPNLGQVLFRGSRDNNVIDLPESRQPNPRTEGITLIKDKEDPDPQRRYKLVYNYYGGKLFTVRTATSTDGLHWTAGPEFPIHEFVEQASFYKHNGLYIVNAQTASPRHLSEGGGNMGRQGFAWVSPDFDHWLQESAASFLLPEPRNPQDRGPHKPYDQVHLGVGAASFGNVLVGFYCIWHNPDHLLEIKDFSGDLGLVVSNDGLHFREPVKGHVFLSQEESPATPAPGKSYPTILCQANGILNVGDETRIYHGRARWGDAYYGRRWGGPRYSEDYYSEVALATLPRDRWGALGLFPDQTEGSVWSAPVTLSADNCQVSLNADAAKDMRVEVSDERFNLLPGYSGADSGRAMSEGGLESAVGWPRRDVAALAGQPVRFRIHLTRDGASEPRLYAVYLKA